MAKQPAADSFTDKGPSRPNSAMGPQFEQWLAFTKQLPGGARRATYRLPASGAQVVQPTTPGVVLDWAVAAASGQLTGIDGSQLPDGAEITLWITDPSRPITIKDNVSSISQSSRILLGADLGVASTSQAVRLVDTGAGWVPSNIFFGPALSAFRAYYGISAGGSAPIATAAQATAGSDDAAIMTAFKVRTALTTPTWLAATAVLLPANVRDADALPYYDGLNLYRVAVSSLLQGVPRKMASFDANLVLGSYYTINHGLPQPPSVVRVTAVCQSADATYPAGTEIWSADLTPYADATKVGWASANPVGVNDGGGGYPHLTPSKWQVRTRYWL